jgi:transcription antitermination factor NusG
MEPTPPDNDELPWYALRVRSNFEVKAAEVLRHKGFQEFLPSYRCRSAWSDRVKWVNRPLFPGYVFCRFSVEDSLSVIRTPGVVAPVAFGGNLVPVETAEIEALRLLVNSAVPLFPHAFLRVGQRVRIDRGPLTGLEGVLERFKEECRIVVSVTLLQRSVAAEIDAEWVSAVR